MAPLNIRSRLRAIVDRGEIPSAAYAVVSDGEVAVGGFGGANPGTVFQIGSVTKAVTGLLLADMAERGQVILSDPATKYLPGAAPGQATLLDLATHTSGLPCLPPGLRRYALLRPGDPYAWYPAGALVRAARRSLATAAGGQPYLYSNYGFGLLGYLLGNAAGVPYRKLVEERVCGPLGMPATTFDATPVQGYSRGKPVGPWHLGVLSAAGGLHSTATDLARLLAACLASEATGLSQAVRAALAPRVTISPKAEIGLAWHHALRDGQRVIWHNGMTGGFSAMVALSPEGRTGVAVLANDGGVPPSPLDALVLDALFES
jgi:D-alanyl-D-alanine-carboxypeptidase/D-alanyl-D-alanine-endopeptidase